MKTILVLGLVAILASLAAAGLFMLRRPAKSDGDASPVPPSKRMARALALRVALSVSLFLVILLAYLMGWIHPTGIPLKTA